MAALLNVDVLLADADPNDVILIRRALQRLDCIGKFLVIANGEEVLTYLQGAGRYANRSIWPLPGVLILDQDLPRISGVDVLCWLRTEPRFSKLPVVLMTPGMPASETALLSGLNAAFHVKTAETSRQRGFLDSAILNALTLTRGGWFRDVRDAESTAAFDIHGMAGGDWSSSANPGASISATPR